MTPPDIIYRCGPPGGGTPVDSSEFLEMRAKQNPTGFGLRLKTLRARAGLSQSVLAARAGLTVSGVAKLEYRTREPSWRTVLDLAAALGVPVSAFVTTGKKA